MWKKESKRQETAKSEQTHRKKQEQKEKRIAEHLYIDEILPLVDFEETLGAGVMEDGSLCDCLQIRTTDLKTLTDGEVEQLKGVWEKLYDVYPGDLAILSYLYPVEIEAQLSYLSRIRGRTKHPVYLKLLDEKEQELLRAQQQFLDQEYALFFYAKDREEHRQNFLTIYTTLSRFYPSQVMEMSSEKKKWLFQKMNNKG